MPINDEVRMFYDVLSVIWPMAIVCVVIFIVGRVWMHFVDAIFWGLKKLLGIGKRKSDNNWSTLEEIRQKDSQK